MTIASPASAPAARRRSLPRSPAPPVPSSSSGSLRPAPRSLARVQRFARGHYLGVFRHSRLERIELVRHGLPAWWLGALAGDMQVPQERLYGWLGIARSTANRKLKEGGTLSQDESERVLGIARLVGQVQSIVAESGSAPDFDAPAWTASFLERPTPAFGGQTPGSFMDTADGRALVEALVAQMQSGAYA